MLARFGRKPMRAMFAYNAGPGRMTTWNKESGELPDDILLDAIHLAQPRQYAKNIIQATLAYAKIHYGIDPLAMLDYLVEGSPLAAPIAAAQAANSESGQDLQDSESGQDLQDSESGQDLQDSEPGQDLQDSESGQDLQDADEGQDKPQNWEDGFPALRGHGEAPE
jgi:hypothetical protein